MYLPQKSAYTIMIGAVVNVGEPVNSNMDDFTFVFKEDTRNGYFASNRDWRTRGR